MSTASGALENRLPGLAAEVAFWTLLSLPALILSAVAATSVIGDSILGGDWQEELIARIVEVAGLALTQTTIDGFVRPALEQLLAGGGIGLVSASFAAAVWTASRAIKAVLTALAVVSPDHQPRKAWQDRLIGFAITLGGLVVGIVLLPLLLAGPALGQQISELVRADLGSFGQLWAALYWPGIVIAATFAIALLYHLGVPGRTRWRYELPGAVLATTVWLAGSAGLRLYGAWLFGGDSVYGPFAGPIVFLLWLWLTGFAVLLGVQFNAELRPTGR